MFLSLLNYLMLSILSNIIMILFVMVGVAYLTMLERKILSYLQFRKGPNKVGFLGLLQPFSDGIKLLSKESGMLILKVNYYLYILCPMMLVVFMLLLWFSVPWFTNIYCMNYSILFLFVLLSLGGFMVLFIGWSSNSIFSLIGSIRFIAQSVSYEVSFMLILVSLMILSESFSLMWLFIWQVYMWNLLILFPMFICFYISVLAEMNRSPMDLVEGESELVSGFNVEYFGGEFALIFIAEYGMIMFFSYIILLLFSNLFFSWIFFFILCLIMVSIIFMRGILPRIRYDELMYVCWKIILPLVLSYLFLIFSFKFILSFMLEF